MSNKKKKNFLKLVDQSSKSREKIIPGILDTIAQLVDVTEELFMGAIRAVVTSLEEKDPYTKGHSIRVSSYAILIGKALKLDENELKKLKLASLLHDIGKIGIADKILKKPGKLTRDEYETMKLHPTKGAKILSHIKGLEDIIPAIAGHHERYDGFGYPEGLKANEIDMLSRIILVADTFDAMTSDRPYRKGLAFEIAYKEIDKNKGTQFDPQIAEAFLKAHKKLTDSERDEKKKAV